jgi:hypothetical protein
MSSVFWLGYSCLLGFDASSQTVENLKREQSAVLNLASVENVDAVNRLALVTGASSVPLHKKLLGYRHEPNKLAVGGLSTLPSVCVGAPRIAECQVQLEAVVESIRAGRHGGTVAARERRRGYLRSVEGRADPAGGGTCARGRRGGSLRRRRRGEVMGSRRGQYAARDSGIGPVFQCHAAQI